MNLFRSGTRTTDQKYVIYSSSLYKTGLITKSNCSTPSTLTNLISEFPVKFVYFFVHEPSFLLNPDSKQRHRINTELREVK